jgi:hypothetical protein
MTKPGRNLWLLLEYYATLSSEPKQERAGKKHRDSEQAREPARESACVRARALAERESHRRKRETSGRHKERPCSQGKEITGRACQYKMKLENSRVDLRLTPTVKPLLSQKNNNEDDKAILTQRHVKSSRSLSPPHQPFHRYISDGARSGSAPHILDNRNRRHVQLTLHSTRSIICDTFHHHDKAPPQTRSQTRSP